MNKINELGFVWRRVFALLHKAAPRISLGVTITTFIEAIASIGVLYAIKVLVDTITAELNASSEADFSAIVFVLVLTGGAVVGAVFFQSINKILRMHQGLLVSDYVDRDIHDRAISADLRYYESPAYYDQLERARQGGARRPAQIVSNAIIMLRAAITLIAIVALLASIELLLLPVLIIPIAIALVIRLYFARRLFNWKMSSAQTQRRAGYFDIIMTHASHAKDLRMNRLGPYIRDRYRDLRVGLRQGEINIEQTRHIFEFLMAVLGAVVFIVASAWLLQQSLRDGRPIGDVVLFVLLLRRAETLGNEFVNSTSKLIDDHLYLRQLFDFLASQPGIRAPENPKPVPAPFRSSLKVSNVSFRYDEAPRDALKNISMEVHPGSVVAIVGANGSGKTTLIKILTRLYDPTDGSIFLDGTEIKDFDPHEFRKRMSVVFQDYPMYADSIENNIKFSDISRVHDRQSVIEAAKTAGAHEFISELPDGYDTNLTKLFDNGHDLSIGQWQRLALARAFYREADIMVLDEPTSAMDPKAEYELFDNFKERLNGRGAILISHRLSTVRQADYTYVLSGGEITEHGTHESLMQRQGAYAELFEKQALKYR